MNFGSLFSGIGGFDLGLDRAGMHCAWQVEIDKHCNTILENHWPEVERYGDIKEVKDLRRVDFVCGGFPCQDLSVAGKRSGLAGERSGLFFEFMRILSEITPQWVLIENVPGLLSSNEGRDMGTVIGELAERGYGWAYRVLDAQYFGVAQRRRRVFIVGCLGDGRSAAEVLFEQESVSGDSPPSREEGKELAKDVAVSLREGEGQRGLTVAHALARGSVSSGYRYDPNGEELIVSGALGVRTCRSVGAQDAACGHLLAIAQNQRGELRTSKVHPQLTCGGGKPGQGYPAVQIGMAARKLTPVECERLQGFPDGWTEGCSDSARYRMLGNAVAVPVAEWIGMRIQALHNRH